MRLTVPLGMKILCYLTQKFTAMLDLQNLLEAQSAEDTFGMSTPPSAYCCARWQLPNPVTRQQKLTIAYARDSE